MVDERVLEELRARGLYDPDAEDAPGRLALLEFLLGLGATVDDLAAAGDGELSGVASTLALRGRPSLTQAEVAERAGVSPEVAWRLWRAAGLPDPGPDARSGIEEDVEALRIFAASIELLGEAETLQLARVIGSSVARIADAMVATFLVNVAAPALEGDPSGLALARTNVEAVELLRAGARAIDLLLRRHVDVGQRPLAQGFRPSQHLSVGFVDLVGSTAFGQQLSIRDLGHVLAEFDELATDVVVGHGGRVVKLIGDEVMFVAGSAGAACTIALDLTAALDRNPHLPGARGAVASGDLLSQDGDYFGPVVGLAARAVARAAPGCVVVSEPTRAELGDGWTCRALGAHELKGFDEPVVLFEVARA